MGALLSHGVGDTTPDPVRAVTSLERGCELGSVHACGLLGAMLLSGTGTAADRPRATALLRQACLGAGEACSDLAEALDDGSDGPDAVLVAALAERACASADHVSCARLGRMYEAGRGGLPRDAGRAFSYYLRGAGELSQAEVDAQARVVALAQTACDAGVVEGCVLRAQSADRGSAPLIRRARTLREAECASGDGHACIELVQDGDGLGTEESVRRAQGTRALTALDHACTGGHGWACIGALVLGEGFGSWLGREDWTTETSTTYATRGATLLRAACDGGDGAACAHLGTTLLAGYSGLAQDYDGARAAFARGCHAHDEDACAGDRQWRLLTP
jgi:TPR repeat protein